MILMTNKLLDDINFKSLLKQIQSELINKVKRKFLSCSVPKKNTQSKRVKKQYHQQVLILE